MNLPDRTSRKRQQTRDRLAEVAFALFERHGYEAVTMEQIAAEADVARGTLYNHFPLKEAVLAHSMHAQLERDLEPLMQEVLARSGLVARLATLLEASAQWWQAHRQYAAPYLRYRFQEVREQQGEPFGSDILAVYRLLIADGQQAREIRTNATPERLARYLHFLYLCALMTWLADADVSLEDEFAQALDFFVAGAAAR